MSGSDYRDRHVVDSDQEEEEEEEDDTFGTKGRRKDKKLNVLSGLRGLLLFRFTKSKTDLISKTKKMKKRKSRMRSVSFKDSQSSSSGAPTTYRFCRPKTEGSSSMEEDLANSSDPKDPIFSDMVRNLLERNDFCSKECNPHPPQSRRY